MQGRLLYHCLKGSYEPDIVFREGATLYMLEQKCNTFSANFSWRSCLKPKLGSHKYVHKMFGNLCFVYCCFLCAVFWMLCTLFIFTNCCISCCLVRLVTLLLFHQKCVLVNWRTYTVLVFIYFIFIKWCIILFQLCVVWWPCVVGELFRIFEWVLFWYFIRIICT